MSIPLPVEGGWSLVAACRTRRELVELLAGLLLETGEPEAVTVDDYADFRADCREVLPAAESEWVASVTLLEIKQEAARQLREGSEAALALVRDEHLSRLAAVAGSDELVVREPAAALAERRELLRSLATRSRSAAALEHEADAHYDALMREPPGGRGLFPSWWPGDRRRDRHRERT